MSCFTARVLSLDTAGEAAGELARIGVDARGIDEMVPKMHSLLVHLSGLQCRQANILKQEMLSLGGDVAVARGTVSCSIESTDAILIGTPKQFAKLCLKLRSQPFSLPSLAFELSKVIGASDSPPLAWQTSRRSLPLQRPLIMGILNVTPDSFSDGGRCFSTDEAVEAAIRMEGEGADIIDVGGESSRPGAVPVSLDEECARILPVIEKLSAKLACAISVDSWKSGVAIRAVAAGAEIINDISGFSFDPEMSEVAASSGAGVVLMHTRGGPHNIHDKTAYSDLMKEICSFLRGSINLATGAGVPFGNLAIDPGLGFSKDPAANAEIIRRLRELSGFGLPIMVGSSRKSFIGKTLGRPDPAGRIFGTAATVALAVANGASILRVHDVEAMRDVALMAHSIVSPGC